MAQSYLSSGNTISGLGVLLESQDGAYTLNLATNGTLEVIETSTNAVISSTNNSKPGADLFLQTFGDLYLVPSGGGIAWEAIANPLSLPGPFYLSMDNDGCLRIYPNYSAPPTPPLSYSDAIWTSYNLQAQSYLTGPVLPAAKAQEEQGFQLTSQNGLFTMVLQNDGNLVVYYWLNGNQSVSTNAVVCFSPETFGTPGRTLYFGGGVLIVGTGNMATSSVYLWEINTNPSGAAVESCLSMDNDGCIRIYPSATPPPLNPASPNTTALWQSPNGALANLMNNPAVAQYPTGANGGFTANQQTMYGVLVQEFNTSFPADVSDLRTDVYPDNETYVPSNVYTTVKDLATPTTFPGTCTAADWAFVQAQILVETNDLSSLLGFQTDFKANTTATQTQLQSSFLLAQGYINTQVGQMGNNGGTPTGVGLLSSVFSGILGIAGAAVPGAGIVCAVMGAIVGILASLPEGGAGDEISGTVLGEEATFETSLNNTMAAVLTQAGYIYPGTPGGLANPIAGDWGKLQQFCGLLGTGALATGSVDYSALSNQFEISFYQMIMKSFTAVVLWTCTDNDIKTSARLGGSISGLYFSYLPYTNCMNPYSLDDNNGQGALWDRLTNGLGISQETIIGTVVNGAVQGWWPCLPYYTGLQELTNFTYGGDSYIYTLQSAAS